MTASISASRRRAAYLLTPEAFLRLGGTALLILGMAGFVLPAAWWSHVFTLDVGQSVGRTLLAAVALTGLRTDSHIVQRRVALAVAAVLVFFGAWGVFPHGEVPAYFFGVAYFGVGDSLLHLLLGFWGGYVAALRPASASADSSPR
jgi:hypothetical protein